MRIPKRGEKGFTLIELLIVVAILGVLAAVIIPNVSRFFGSGEEEARKTEKASVQLAVGMMMSDNHLSTIPNVEILPTNAMNAFPDSSSDWVTGGKTTDPGSPTTSYAVGDKEGYILHQHDMEGGGDQINLVNYMPSATSEYQYRCSADGIVYQYEKDGEKLPADKETYPIGW